MLDLKSIMNLRRLRFINRCSNFHKIHPEDDAQHSFFTAVLAIACLEDLEKDLRANHSLSFADLKINKNKVVYRALLHDIAESITGDVPHNTKRFIASKYNPDLDLELDEFARGLIPELNDLFVYLNHGGDAHSLEEAIVSLVDILELLLYTYEEITMGNSLMLDMLKKCISITRDRITGVSDMIMDQELIITGVQSRLPLFNWIQELLDVVSNVDTRLVDFTIIV